MAARPVTAGAVPRGARAEATNLPALAVYVHWPFCAALCPYCDFNSHVAREVDHEGWAAAFEAEIDRHARETGPARVTSVYFGGGTPSLMAPATVARVLARLDARYGLATDAEITLEANPTSVEADRLASFRAAGVGRVSLGVQALDDAALRRLGRQHDAAAALRALETARGLFERVSFDLIYARQDQSVAAWEAELGQALGLGPDHLSLYQLSIEAGTPFGRRYAAGTLRGLPDDDRAADLLEATRAITAAAGVPWYEVSNHARPGAESEHNLAYWRLGSWIGIGPGAHGRHVDADGTLWATEGVRRPAAWRAAVVAGTGDAVRRQVDAVETAEMQVVFGLRLREGISLSRHTLMGGSDLTGRAEALAANGLVVRKGDRLRTTARGAMLLDAVIEALLV